jgi:NTE family protein
MLAFVFSGGGNRGALQVGALQVLLEAGIKPDLLIGSSIGAVNAVMIGADPTPRGAYQLADAWRRVTRHDVYPGHALTPVWSLIRGYEGLYPNGNWYQFLRRIVPVKTFGEIQGSQVRIVATDLETADLMLFGDDPEMGVAEALMASTALPPMHAPWRINGRPYIDGGTVADLPLRVALDMGAKTIFALNVANCSTSAGQIQDVLGVSNQAIHALLRRQVSSDLEHVRGRKGVRLYELDLRFEAPGEAWDFSQSGEMIDMGRIAARRLLAEVPLPGEPMSQWLSRATAPLTTNVGRVSAQLRQRFSDTTAGLGEQLTRAATPIGATLSLAAEPLLTASTERFASRWPWGKGPGTGTEPTGVYSGEAT